MPRTQIANGQDNNGALVQARHCGGRWGGLRDKAKFIIQLFQLLIKPGVLEEPISQQALQLCSKVTGPSAVHEGKVSLSMAGMLESGGF